jgi:Uncharacterised protein family UPF0102
MKKMARRAEPVRSPKPVPRLERVAAFRLGLSAESRAALLLIAEAYRIGVLVFVEVKARDSVEEAVTERSKRRIVGAADAQYHIADSHTAKCHIARLTPLTAACEIDAKTGLRKSGRTARRCT